MNKKVILFMCLVLLAACTGCKTEAGTEEETGVETESGKIMRTDHGFLRLLWIDGTV